MSHGNKHLISSSASFFSVERAPVSYTLVHYIGPFDNSYLSEIIEKQLFNLIIDINQKNAIYALY